MRPRRGQEQPRSRPLCFKALRRHVGPPERRPTGPRSAVKNHADQAFKKNPATWLPSWHPSAPGPARLDSLQTLQTALIWHELYGHLRTAEASERNCIVHYTSRTGAKVIGCGAMLFAPRSSARQDRRVSASREINIPPLPTALLGKEEMHAQLLRTTPDPQSCALERPVIGGWRRVSNLAICVARHSPLSTMVDIKSFRHRIVCRAQYPQPASKRSRPYQSAKASGIQARKPLRGKTIGPPQKRSNSLPRNYAL